MKETYTCEHSGVTFEIDKLNNCDYRKGYNLGYLEGLEDAHIALGNIIIAVKRIDEGNKK